MDHLCWSRFSRDEVSVGTQTPHPRKGVSVATQTPPTIGTRRTYRSAATQTMMEDESRECHRSVTTRLVSKETSSYCSSTGSVPQNPSSCRHRYPGSWDSNSEEETTGWAPTSALRPIIVKPRSLMSVRLELYLPSTRTSATSEFLGQPTSTPQVTLSQRGSRGVSYDPAGPLQPKMRRQESSTAPRPTK